MGTIRPLEPADAEAGASLAVTTFGDLTTRLGLESRMDPAAAHEQFAARFRYLPGTDPAGCWAIDGDDGQLDGAALSLRRGNVWGLSLLVIRPGRQGAGLGRRLLAASLRHSAGDGIGIICASDDPRAGRAYRDAGFRLTPAYEAAGEPRLDGAPNDRRVRCFDLTDGDFVDAVDLRVRGGPRGDDYRALLADGTTWLRYEHAGVLGYAGVRSGGEILTVAAPTAEAARSLLRQALVLVVERGTSTRLGWYTAAQDWAHQVVAEAGLTITRWGQVCWRGRSAPVGYVPYAGLL